MAEIRATRTTSASPDLSSSMRSNLDRAKELRKSILRDGRVTQWATAEWNSYAKRKH